MIKSTDFVSEDAKRAAEGEALGALLDVFAKELGGKIFQNLQEGSNGWDNPAVVDEMKRKLLTDFQKGDMVSVAACAMFLWNLQDHKV